MRCKETPLEATDTVDDVRAALTLLWRADEPPARRPGPKPKVGIARIVAEAVALADEQGLAGVSMRAMGDRLGTTAMALYSHVPSKTVLIHLMVDRVHGELADAPPSGGSEDWRTALERWAAEALEFHLRHPWLLRTPHTRAVMGPHVTAVVDHLASIVLRSGSSAPRSRALVSGLFHLVRGTAEAITEARRAPGEDGSSDEAWWSTLQATLADVAPDLADRYPSLTHLERVEPGPVGDPATFLERRSREVFGHEVRFLLDGVSGRDERPAR